MNEPYSLEKPPLAGDRVLILRGRLKDYPAHVDSVDVARGVATVMLEVLGGRPIEVAIEDMAPAPFPTMT